MNIFQSTFTDRLNSWRDLRHSTLNLDTKESCIIIDKWWQQAPIINHHLHWSDPSNWPDPWTLLSENTYCTLTRAIGMCYTLLMAAPNDVELVMATDDQCEDHFLVLVDGAKYTLNYWPNSVLSTSLASFTIHRSLPLDELKKKIK